MEQVLAYRVAAQGLAARDRTLAEVAGSFGLQDSPPGAALTALAARSGDAAELDGALELLLARCGLVVEERYGDYARGPWSAGSRRYLWLAS